MVRYGPNSTMYRSKSVSPPPTHTVLESFNYPLPTLKVGGETTYTSVRPSGTGTARAITPKVLLCCSATPLLDEAELALNDNRIRFTPGSGLPRPSTNRRTASDFNSWSKRSEQDIIAASQVYILENISEILRLVYPAGWHVSAEITDVGLNATASTKSKSEDKENLRYDMMFHAPPERDGKKGKTIAIVEFKKAGQIRYRDFQEALISINDASSEPGRDGIFDKKKRARGEGATNLGFNAESFTKQVCKYAKNREYWHIALFNWDHLLVYDFTKLNEPKSKDNAGEEAELIWAHEGNEAGEFIQRCPIRKAMLGWILKAFEEHFDGQ